MWRTLPTAYIKGIGKTVTLGQALFSLLRYKFIGYNDSDVKFVSSCASYLRAMSVFYMHEVVHYSITMNTDLYYRRKACL